MANISTGTRQRRSRLHGSKRGTPAMSERQLDAYLQTRDTLRRLRALARLTAGSRDASTTVSAT